MKQRKPRTKDVPFYANWSCDPDECHYPWANRCVGDVHKCMKMKMQWLAGLSEKERDKQLIKISKGYCPTRS